MGNDIPIPNWEKDVSQLTKDTENAFKDTYDTVEEFARRLTSFNGAVDEIKNAIISGLQGTIDNVGEIVGDVNNIIDHQIPNVVGTIQSVPNNVANQVQNQLDAAVDAIFGGLATIDVEYQEALTLGYNGNVYNDGSIIDASTGCSGSELYYNAGPIDPSPGYNPANIQMTDSMTISMDIVINTWPNVGEYQSIFLLNTNSDRRPGIWINGDSATGRGFHIYYTEKATSQSYDPDFLPLGHFDTFQSLELNTLYTVKIISDPSMFVIMVNDQIMYQSDSPQPVTIPNYPVPIYFGQPNTRRRLFGDLTPIDNGIVIPVPGPIDPIPIPELPTPEANVVPSADVAVSNVLIRSGRCVCIGSLYSNPGPIDPSPGYNPSNIKMTQTMTYSMDIIINSWPNVGEFQSIFLLNTVSDRRPGIWINGDSATGRGFHIVYTEKAASQAYDQGAVALGHFDTLQSLELNTLYTVKMFSDPTNFIIKINGQVVYNNGNAQPIGISNDVAVPIYFGQDGQTSADVTISNVVISSGDCFDNAFNRMFETSPYQILKRECRDCINTAKEIYYRRLTPITGTVFNAYEYLKDWKSQDNDIGVDFNLYSSINDAYYNINAWTYCNYDDPGIGFPRDCGPNGGSTDQWTGDNKGQKSKFSIVTSITEKKGNVLQDAMSPLISPVTSEINSLSSTSQSLLTKLDVCQAIGDGIDGIASGVTSSVNSIETGINTMTSSVTTAADEIARVGQVVDTVKAEVQALPDKLEDEIIAIKDAVVAELPGIVDTMQSNANMIGDSLTNTINIIGDKVEALSTDLFGDLFDLIGNLAGGGNPFDLGVGDDIKSVADSLETCFDGLSSLNKFDDIFDIISLPSIPIPMPLPLPDFSDLFYIMLAIPIAQDDNIKSMVLNTCDQGVPVVINAVDAFYSSLTPSRRRTLSESIKKGRRRLSDDDCTKTDGIFCDFTAYRSPTLDSLRLTHAVEAWPDLIEKIDGSDYRYTVNNNKYVTYKHFKEAFKMISGFTGKVCEVIDSMQADVVNLASTGAVFMMKDGTMQLTVEEAIRTSNGGRTWKENCAIAAYILDVAADIINMGLDIGDALSDLIVASQATAILENSGNIIKNQAILYEKLKEQISSNDGNSGNIGPSAASFKPSVDNNHHNNNDNYNMIRLEMTVSEFIIKLTVLGVVWLCIGLLIGKCIWGSNVKSHKTYNPVKFESETEAEEIE